jgi:ribose 5-phosphate isomerase RpiB
MKPTAGEIEPADIEQIVREVLRRLAPAGDAFGQHGNERNQRTNENARPTLTGGVISLADVDGRLADAKTIQLARGAIMTPAARDYLKQRGIAITWDNAGGLTRAPASVHPLVLGVAETRYDPSIVLGQLRKRAIHVQQLARTGLASVVQEMCDAVALDGQRGLLLTSETTAAVCMTNRRRGVRAAAANDSATADAATQSVAANLLVIDPLKTGTFQLQRMAERLSQAELHPSATLARLLD